VLDDQSIFDHLVKAAPAAQAVDQAGVLADGERLATQVFERTYLNSYVAHAAMETHSAVAAVENGKITVWAGTQTPFPLKSQVAQALKLGRTRFASLRPYRRGRFGGKSASRQAIEAARLATITGTPVRVVFSARRSSSSTRSVPQPSSRSDRASTRPRRLFSGTTWHRSRRARLRPLLQHSAPPHRDTGVGTQTRRACIRSPSGPGGRLPPTAMRSPGSRRLTSWRPRWASIPWSSA